nr:hypothetical protein [Brevibacillus laterosporus]
MSDEQGYKTLTRDLGISVPSILRGWVDHYRKEGIQGLEKSTGEQKILLEEDYEQGQRVWRKR